jgi:superfamily II DNA/RNA helicase
MSFQSFSLDPRVLAGVEALGYTQPTPIQQRAIPPLLQGHDIVGIAQTGTGKTAAFRLPILERLVMAAAVACARRHRADSRAC